MGAVDHADVAAVPAGRVVVAESNVHDLNGRGAEAHREQASPPASGKRLRQEPEDAGPKSRSRLGGERPDHAHVEALAGLVRWNHRKQPLDAVHYLRARTRRLDLLKQILEIVVELLPGRHGLLDPVEIARARIFVPTHPFHQQVYVPLVGRG